MIHDIITAPLYLNKRKDYTMLKTLMVAILGVFLFNSQIALSADPITAEKYLCSKTDIARTLRLYAPAVGETPCKVFYSKRVASDPNDVQIEADQNAGLIKPIFYSNNNGEFCVRKMKEFREERVKQGWNCVKL